MSRSQRVVAACSVVVLLVVQASAMTPARAARPAPVQYVKRSGTGLVLGTTPYRFTGINIYNANSRADECWYTMGEGPLLDEALTALGPGNEVIRAWFFQSLATDDGVRNWAGFDHTLAVAKAHGVKVIVTLTNQWGDCEGSGTAQDRFKNADWYGSGYRETVDPEGTTTYLAWVSEVVNRYKADPTVLMWQLVNEAEVKDDLDAPTCSGGGAGILRTFAETVGRTVRKIDRNHLVSLGTIGGGQCGTQGDEYLYVHAAPSIDVCEFHDYAPNDPLPGDEFNGLQVRIDQCNALNKPLFVGETGIRPNDTGGTLEGRAAAFAAKLDAQIVGAGIDGVLAWAYSKDGSLLDNFDIGAGDPVIAVLGDPAYN